MFRIYSGNLLEGTAIFIWAAECAERATDLVGQIFSIQSLCAEMGILADFGERV